MSSEQSDLYSKLYKAIKARFPDSSSKTWVSKNLKTGRPGRGVVLEIRTNPDKGREGGLKIRDFAGRPK